MEELSKHCLKAVQAGYTTGGKAHAKAEMMSEDRAAP